MPELFPYRPLSPITEALHWTTDLVETFDGGESRRAVRAIPRQEWEWQVVVEDQRHLSLLRGQQTQSWYVPAWQEGVVTTAQITAGAGTIAVDTTTGEWRDRMIAWTSPTYCEVLTIASITASEVTLTGTVSQTYATGATIAPVRLARCGSSLGLEEAPYHGRLFILWLVMDAAALTDYDLPVQYDGSDVLMEPVLLDGDYLASELHAPLELLDYGTGIIEPIARYEASRWSVPEARLRLEGRTDAWNIKQWLHKLQGRFLGFYAGSRKRELTIAATFTAADTELTVRRIDYALLEDTGVDDLLLFERHGSLDPIVRKVIGSAAVDATTETLTLNTTIGIAGQSSTFKAISWLHGYRLGADRIELSWEAADRLELRLPMTEATVAPPPYEPPTFWTTFGDGALKPQDEVEIEISDTEVLSNNEMHIQPEVEIALSTTEILSEPLSGFGLWEKGTPGGQYINFLGLTQGGSYWIGVGGKPSGQTHPAVLVYPDETGYYVIFSDPGNEDYMGLTWRGTAYGDGKWVAVGPSGYIMSCLDDINGPARTNAWTIGTITSSVTQWNSVIFANSVFVAVGEGHANSAMYSSDGLAWTVVAAPSTTRYNDLAYGGGYFVAVGEGASSIIVSNDDGATWTAVTSPASIAWQGITYGDDKFVAVGEDGAIYCDVGALDDPTDANDWHVASGPQRGSWKSVAYGGGYFVAVPGGSLVTANNDSMYSTDAITWYPLTMPNGQPGSIADALWTRVGFHGDLFVAVSFAGVDRLAVMEEVI